MTPLDARDYTYKGERDALLVSVIILGLIVFTILKIMAISAIIIIVVALFYIRIRQGQLLGNSALVTNSNFQRANYRVSLACSRLGLNPPRIHVLQDPYLNAFAMGFSKPFSVILHSAVLDSMDDGELSFIIGHELGHIKSGHTTWLSIISPLGTTIPGFRLIFGVWQRKAEYTSDRAGLIVCQDLDTAIRAILKVSLGPSAPEHVNLSEFLKQSGVIHSSQMARIGELLGTHPYITNRIKALIAFSQSSIYQNITGPMICPRCGTMADIEDSFCVICSSSFF
jgi:Zn-dependent protease with chaperone function